MKRRERPAPALPERLRVFDPSAWVRPGEDPKCPLTVHYFAYGRWSAELRQRSAEPGGQAIGWTPREGSPCRCWQCSGR